MQIIQTIAELRRELAVYKKKGKTIGLVPTMGALHEGHLSLVQKSAEECDATVVSVFVNPTQFGKNEDLDKYPRRLEKDAEAVEGAGASFVFAPSAEEMYPNGKQLTWVRNETLENAYCGKYREGHFRGVLTVVTKLFAITKADRAYFGKKDYQQAFLIRRMTDDLNFDVRVELLPIIREESGLARSSRNEYMSEIERTNAASIYRGLLAGKSAYDAGERRISALRDIVMRPMLMSGIVVQYIEIVSRKDLKSLHGLLKEDAVILVAGFSGKTRLIDNLEL
ncbi:MAG: pantoate--beta-alanine ligase [Fibrobacter sp.]|jgi:pantoate--beta-alanine ligase|nr:pantoate--beta-alanine ligase [Fibrobacter sp.]